MRKAAHPHRERTWMRRCATRGGRAARSTQRVRVGPSDQGPGPSKDAAKSARLCGSSSTLKRQTAIRFVLRSAGGRYTNRSISPFRQCAKLQCASPRDDRVVPRCRQEPSGRWRAAKALVRPYSLVGARSTWREFAVRERRLRACKEQGEGQEEPRPKRCIDACQQGGGPVHQI
jgi:hypothetical protein